MGRMPSVLKMARQMNHASWLLRALFHRAINFQTPSQIARRMTTETIKIISGAFMFASIAASRGVFIGWFSLIATVVESLYEIARGPPLSIIFQAECNAFLRVDRKS